MKRRDFLHRSLVLGGWFASSQLLASSDGKKLHAQQSLLGDISPLQAPDANGVRLPEGFSSKVVATAGEKVGNSNYPWHFAPDGGACFASKDGWIYVSNSELPNGYGGVGAIAFNADGSIKDAYPILSGTHRNCAGGKTPYNTWLSCEEVPDGLVYECDPFGEKQAVVRPALGRFNHEAVVYHKQSHVLYLTEDRPDGGFYRYIPDQLTADGWADLDKGRLQVAEVLDLQKGTAVWHDIPDPSASQEETRNQVSKMTRFNGGEGMDIIGNNIYFTTKGNNALYVYHQDQQRFSLVYSAATSNTPILTGVDNVHVNPMGDVLVAEDGGDMQVVVITRDGIIKPLLQVVGQDGSEITGPAFSPDMKHFYFSSQRGKSGSWFDGITYEVTGPFFKAVKL